MLKLHFSIFLLGLTGVIGKFVLISPASLVFGRTLIAVLILFAVSRFKGLPLPTRRHVWGAFPVGLLLALHWITFFQAIQVSSVAIGLLSFSTYPVFVVILDPLLTRAPLKLHDLLYSGVAFLGLLLVVQEDSPERAVLAGVLWGIFAGFTCAVLTLWNKHRVRQEDPVSMGMLQNFWAAIVSIPFAPALAEARMVDLGLLLCLGAFCTALAHCLFIASLKTVRAQVASIAVGLEPLYGIFFATLLLNEWPTIWEIAGGAIILTAVILSAWTSNRSDLTPNALPPL